MSYFNPPRPAYANPPIEPQFFAPDVFTIVSIGLGDVTTVTTATTFYGATSNYVVGQTVRFVIPRFYGCQQINNMIGIVIAILGINQFTVDINSKNYDAFIATAPYAPNPAQVVAVGDVNTGVINMGRSNNGTFIPGSFVNIS